MDEGIKSVISVISKFCSATLWQTRKDNDDGWTACRNSLFRFHKAMKSEEQLKKRKKKRGRN